MKPVRLAWLATHPIQYQAPLLRALARSGDIEPTALFFSDMSVRGYVDPGFGGRVEWDVPLLEGYRHEFLPGTGDRVTGLEMGFLRPLIRGLRPRLTADQFDAVLVQGWNHYGYPLGAWLARRAGLKVLMRSEATSHIARSTGAKRIVRDALVRWTLGNVDHFMAIGTRNREFYISRGILEHRIGSMPYAVDNEFFRLRAAAADRGALREALGLRSAWPIVLYAGKLTTRKRADDLLEAYARVTVDVPQSYLLIVGDGELRASLEVRAAELALRSVRFLGFKNQQELPDYYALADVFVLPSFNETWGLTVNEAMNAGCAIVASDQVGCALDLVKDGENGYVFPAGNIGALTSCLRSALGPGRSRRMGQRSLEIISGWGLEASIAGLRRVLGGGHRPS